METSDRAESGTVSGFFVGAVVGAGIALLLAPQSGAQMRGLLRDWAARAQDGFDGAVDRGVEVMDSAIDRGHDFVEKGKRSLRETGRQAQDFAEAGKTALHDAKDRLTSEDR